MFDPLTILIVGGGIVAFRELNRKDYGILTPQRDERYRNAMEYCYQPDLLLKEAKLFAEHGLKAQAMMLKRRSEWRGRSDEVKASHEAVFQKALKSTNITAILDVANAFEGWTATKKAQKLRDRVRELQEQSVTETAKKSNGASNGTTESQVQVKDTAVGDDL